MRRRAITCHKNRVQMTHHASKSKCLVGKLSSSLPGRKERGAAARTEDRNTETRARARARARHPDRRMRARHGRVEAWPGHLVFIYFAGQRRRSSVRFQALDDCYYYYVRTGVQNRIERIDVRTTRSPLISAVSAEGYSGFWILGLEFDYKRA